MCGNAPKDCCLLPLLHNHNHPAFSIFQLLSPSAITYKTGALLSAFAFIRERGAELYSAWSAVLLFSLSATGYLAPSFAPTRWSAEAVPSFVLCRAGIMYDSGNFITSNCLFLHYFGPLRRNSSPAWLTVLVIVRLMFNRTSVIYIYFSSLLASCSNGNFITLNCFFLQHLDFT